MDRQGAFPVQRRPPESKLEHAFGMISCTCPCRGRVYIRVLNALARDGARHYWARSHIRPLDALAHDVKGLGLTTAQAR